MSNDEPTGSGNPPEGTPPLSDAVGSGGIQGFEVRPDGSTWFRGEPLEKGEMQQSFPQAEQTPKKVRIGDEEISMDEIKALREEAEAVRRMKAEIEPFDTIIKDSRFRALLEQGVAEGYWEAPAIPAAQPADMGKYHVLQTTDPLFDDVREKMISYSANLSFEQREALNTNPTFFLKIYNEIRSTAGDKPLPRRNTDVSDIVRRIQLKEKAKVAAVLQRPGGSDHESSDRAAERRSYKSDMQLLRTGNNDQIANVLMKRFFNQDNE